jgi:hypothetical protein
MLKKEILRGQIGIQLMKLSSCLSFALNGFHMYNLPPFLTARFPYRRETKSRFDGFCPWIGSTSAPSPNVVTCKGPSRGVCVRRRFTYGLLAAPRTYLCGSSSVGGFESCCERTTRSLLTTASPLKILSYKSSPKLVSNGSPSVSLKVRPPSICRSARRKTAFCIVLS